MSEAAYPTTVTVRISPMYNHTCREREILFISSVGSEFHTDMIYNLAY